MKTDTKLRSNFNTVADQELDGFKASAADSEVEDSGVAQEGWVTVVDICASFNEAGYKMGNTTAGSPEKDGVLIFVKMGGDERGQEAVEIVAGSLERTERF